MAQAGQRKTMTVVASVVAILAAAAAIGYEIWSSQPHGASVVIDATGQAPKAQAMKAMQKSGAGGDQSDPMSVGGK